MEALGSTYKTSERKLLVIVLVAFILGGSMGFAFGALEGAKQTVELGLKVLNNKPVEEIVKGLCQVYGYCDPFNVP